MRHATAVALTVSFVTVAACDDKPPPMPAPVASTTGSAAPASSMTIRVSFDGEEREVVVKRAPRSLVDVLPEAGRDPNTWRGLRVVSKDEKRIMAVRRFTEKYREHDVRLYLDDEGRPSVGIFRRVRPDMPAHVQAKLAKPHVALVDAATVEVRTQEVKVTEPENPPLTLSLDGAEKPFPVDELSALKKYDPPGGDDRKGSGKRRKRRGWRLQDVVALVTDIKSVSHVKLVSKEQDSLMVKGSALAAEEVTALLRYNNRGGLGVSSWDQERPGEPRRMRDVTKIIIVTKSK